MSQTATATTTGTKAISLDDALSEVETRFLLHLPDSELTRPDRLLFWIQEASWFYDDFFADHDARLPRFTFKAFTKAVFNHCPLFAGMENNVDDIFREFGAYRSKIPVHGCIVLNPEMTKVLLVCSWNGGSWTFPRGKVNENELPIDCAAREMMEETGFDVRPHINEQDTIRFDDDGGSIELFIVSNVPETTQFNPQSRKEISRIEFFPLNNLPSNSFAVKQFLPELRKWIKTRSGARSNSSTRKQQKFASPAPQARRTASSTSTASATIVTSIAKRSGSSKKIKLNEAALFNARNADTFKDEDGERWSVNDMFKANAQLTGRQFQEYDGNPHHFGSSHPRYVNYNASSTAAASTAAGTAISASALLLSSIKPSGSSNIHAQQQQFAALASQSEEFHKFRGNEKSTLEEQSQSQSKTMKKDSLSSKRRVTVTVEELSVSASTSRASGKKSSSTMPSSADRDAMLDEQLGIPKLLPVRFRLDASRIMARIDRAVGR